jgi:integral membrane protein
MPGTPAVWFRTVAVAEAISWLGLLVGMFFKYIAGGSEAGVHVFGPIHGAVFVLYVLTVLVVRRPLRWDARTTLVALAASVPPLGSVVFERWATGNGRLPASGRRVAERA